MSDDDADDGGNGGGERRGGAAGGSNDDDAAADSGEEKHEGGADGGGGAEGSAGGGMAGDDGDAAAPVDADRVRAIGADDQIDGGDGGGGSGDGDGGDLAGAPAEGAAIASAITSAAERRATTRLHSHGEKLGGSGGGEPERKAPMRLTKVGSAPSMRSMRGAAGGDKASGGGGGGGVLTDSMTKSSKNARLSDGSGSLKGRENDDINLGVAQARGSVARAQSLVFGSTCVAVAVRAVGPSCRARPVGWRCRQLHRRAGRQNGWYRRRGEQGPRRAGCLGASSRDRPHRGRQNERTNKPCVCVRARPAWLLSRSATATARCRGTRGRRTSSTSCTARCASGSRDTSRRAGSGSASTSST